MTVDKFGRLLKTARGGAQGPRGHGFQLTADGNFDLDSKRLCKLGAPVDSTDAVPKNYVDEKIIPVQEGHYNFGNRKLRNVGTPYDHTDAVNLRTMAELCMFSDQTDSSWNGENKRIKNIAAPIDGSDAVNKAYMDSYLNGVGAAISHVTVDLNTLRERVSKDETFNANQISQLKTYFKNSLKRFGEVIFALSRLDPNTYLDWDIIFREPEVNRLQ